nr:hypothetical protein StreXyl84_55010 [Streptomyces sp. Xyl84]
MRREYCARAERLTAIRAPGAARDRAGRAGRPRAGTAPAVPVLAAPARAEYDPPNTRTSWEDGRWGG